VISVQSDTEQIPKATQQPQIPKPNQNKTNQPKTKQTKPKQTKPNQTKPNQTKTNPQDSAGVPEPLPRPLITTSAYFELGGRQPTPAYGLDQLSAGQRVRGPAILIDKISTIVVEPGWSAFVTGDGNVRIDRLEAPAAGGAGAAAGGAAGAAGADGGGGAVECDPIQLAIFSHRCGWIGLFDGCFELRSDLG